MNIKNKAKLPKKYNNNSKKDWMLKVKEPAEEKKSLKAEIMEKLVNVANLYNNGFMEKEDLLSELIDIGKKVKAKKSVVEENFNVILNVDAGESRKNRVGAWELAEMFLDRKDLSKKPEKKKEGK